MKFISHVYSIFASFLFFNLIISMTLENKKGRDSLSHPYNQKQYSLKCTYTLRTLPSTTHREGHTKYTALKWIWHGYCALKCTLCMQCTREYRCKFPCIQKTLAIHCGPSINATNLVLDHRDGMCYIICVHAHTHRLWCGQPWWHTCKLCA